MKKVLAIFLMVMLLSGSALAASATPAATTAPVAEVCPHTETEMAISQAATCTEPGSAVFVCTACGETVGYSYIPPTGHSYVVTVTPATCTEQGFTTHTCSVCGDSYKDTVTEVTGHSYAGEVTPATCTEQGFTTHVCGNCGDSYVDTYTEAGGHNYQYQYDAVVAYDEAGSAAGYESYGTWMCENCGDVVAASEGNAIFYMESVLDAGEDAEAPVASASSGSSISDAGWVTLEVIMVIVLVVECIALMLTFEKKKPGETAAQ